MRTRVFVSHNVNDKTSAEAFVRFFTRLGLEPEEIACFSFTETAFDLGSQWQDEINAAVEQSELFIVLYSQHFRFSHICQKELGMALAFKKPIYWISVDGSFPHDPFLSDRNGVPGPDKFGFLIESVSKTLGVEDVKPVKAESISKSLKSDLADIKQDSKRKIHRRGEVPEDLSYIDATLYISGREFFDPAITVKKLVQNDQAIPEELLYLTPSGADSWVKLCDDDDYVTFQSSLQFIKNNAKKILNAIGDEVISLSPDFISLGPGNGEKDKYLLREMICLSKEKLDRPFDVYYYPFDLSIDLLKTSIKEVCESELNKDHLKIKAICADFSDLREFKPIFDYRPQPNIYSLLGNTLGNLSAELDFLKSVKGAMNLEDYLILEVRLKEGWGDAAPGGKEERRKKFNFAPLAQLGIKFSNQKLRYVESDVAITQIRGTRTIQGIYGPYRLDKENYRTQVCAINHYDLLELCSAAAGIGFEVVEKFESDDKAVGIVILRPDASKLES